MIMKKIFERTVLLLLLSSTMLLSSCYKKYDPASYQPPFTINGFTSVAEIGGGSLVGYWAFNGNYVDSVSNTAGTPKSTTFAPGFKGQALQGATNAYVLAAPSNAIKTLQSFTISEWVNTPPPSNGIIGIFSLANTTKFWGNIEIFFENGSDNTNGKLRVHVGKNGTDNTYSVDNVRNLFNSWVNITVSYDASSSMFNLFVNGSKVHSGTAGTLTGPLNFVDVGNLVFGTVQFMTTPSQTSTHGAEPWASFLTGQIDEVRVYNKALTESEVQALVVLQGKGK